MPFVADVKVRFEGVEIKGRAADISIEGIFIEAATLPDAGTEIEVVFELQGNSIWAGGVVSWLDSPMGFGVRLDRLREEDRGLILLYVMATDP